MQDNSPALLVGLLWGPQGWFWDCNPPVGGALEASPSCGQLWVLPWSLSRLPSPPSATAAYHPKS